MSYWKWNEGRRKNQLTQNNFHVCHTSGRIKEKKKKASSWISESFFFWWFKHNFTAHRKWYDRHRIKLPWHWLWEYKNRVKWGLIYHIRTKSGNFTIALTDENRKKKKERFNVSFGRVWWAVGRWWKIHFVIKICAIAKQKKRRQSH